MNVLEFNYDENKAEEGFAKLADSMKMLLFQKDSSFFEKIDFNNDKAFTEPALFFYFKCIEQGILPQISYKQILFSYVNKDDKDLIPLSSDPEGNVNIPGMGTTNVGFPFSESFTFNMSENALVSNKLSISLDDFVSAEKAGCFDLRKDQPEILYNYYDVELLEKIALTQEENKKYVKRAINLIKEIDDSFYSVVEKTTRELTVFNTTGVFSFAGLSYCGNAFINLYDKKDLNEIFFLEDIAHQCGHIMLYPLILNGKEYLNYDKETPLKQFTKVDRDDRSIYGAFHGLFTYSTILHVFDKLIKSNKVRSEDYIEIWARMGFCMRRFLMDLGNLNDTKILSRHGIEFYDQFFESYLLIKSKYNSEFKYFKYHDQDYVFDYQIFKKENKI